jgi:hypothetical protein
MRHTVGKVTEEILELSLGGAQDISAYKVQYVPSNQTSPLVGVC